MNRRKHAQSVDNNIKNRIYGHGRGWCFTPTDFDDLGSSDAILKTLQRLVAVGTIRRLVQGIYDYPENHPKLGPVFPSVETVANALARKQNVRIQPSGAYAANMLNLSEQVPARVVFLTEGQARKVKIEKLTIIFKKTTSKNMSLAGTEMGLIIQALKYFGREAITEEIVKSVKGRILKTDIKTFKKANKVAPIWMKKIFSQIIRGKHE